MSQDDFDELMTAILAIAGQLELPAVLDRLVQASTTLTGAQYAAINILDDDHSIAFVQSGVDAETAIRIGQPPGAVTKAPRGNGVLSQIPAVGAMRLDRVEDHPSFGGWPDHHPHMGTFLGASVRVDDHVFGQVYLADKPGGFTERDEQRVLRLAATTGVAVANARLYAEAERRERWQKAAQEIATMLLEGLDEEEALSYIGRKAREVALADTVALVMPGVDGELLVELADGHAADTLLGQVMPADGRTSAVLTEQRGILLRSLSDSPVDALRPFGPAMYAPMQTGARGVGVLVLLRRLGQQPFDDDDLVTAESFAAQAAMAFVLAEARHAQDIAALLDERERIARDLHDLAIQQLFATGMQLESARLKAVVGGLDPAEVCDILDQALDNVDESVREIRGIVHALRDPDEATSLVERLRREASLARTGLGFAPSLVLELDGEVVDERESGEGLVIDEEILDDRISSSLNDDVVAVVREGLANAARHANASSVTVRVSVTGLCPWGTVSIEVRDDGRGLPPDNARRSGTGNLASRAHKHGGSFSLTPSPDGLGTLLAWQAPLRP
ncbi:MAG: GAF domain-containing protein [Micrococcales bacterium]|nr:GAF domain-containing protein [Micrococcales bacterium]MCL2667209.1 GAF domain-containing protein [Micrococcales bacterium]